MHFKLPWVFLFNHPQNKSYFFHIEKDTIKFRNRQQCNFKDSIVIYVTCVYDIVYLILKSNIRYVFDSIAFR